MEVGLGLVGHLEVGRLGDALAGQRGPELVVHHLDLLVDQDVRELERRVGDGVLDDPVGEPVARPIERVALEAMADLDAQRVEVGELAHRLGEVVVQLGQDLLAKLLEVDREVGRWPARDGSA